MTVVPPPMFNTPSATSSATRVAVVAPPKATAKPRAPRPSSRTNGRAAPTGGLAKDIEQAFEDVEHDGPEPAGEGKLEQDAPTREEVERLFRQIAAEHARHLRDFAFELSIGETSRQWAELCSPSLGALRRAADEMQQDTLQVALRRLEEIVDEARTSAEPRIEGHLRERLLERYGALQQALPEAFAYETEGNRREPIIVDALLRLVPGMHRIAIDKLYAAGIDSLSRLHAANAFDLSRAAGLDTALCEAIVERFARYREERATAAPDDVRSHERDRLATLARELRQRQAEFREAELEEDIPRRRTLRNQRHALVTEIELVLAQLGENELIHQLARASVERKLDRIEAYLRDGAAPPTSKPTKARAHGIATAGTEPSTKSTR